MNEQKKDLVMQEKKELETQKEHTTPLKRYIPATDIVENENELLVFMDMPGVAKEDIAVNLEKNVLKIDGKINMKDYSDLKPLYTEYNVGNYTRQFELSNKIDQSGIEAKMEDGVLSLVLPKIPEAQPRSIQIT
ncbi:MAG: Hsp20/alpha crystallin family protein [Proteobacteria bacterium]|nr:Hsp20/alpha crystallin family protein [Pseudomonadota bacterium]